MIYEGERNMLRRKLVLLAFGIISCASSTPVLAQRVKLDPAKRERISERELIRRYPVGKAWVSTKVFRLRGVSEAKQWGLEDEQHVVYTNRYQSYTKVLENDLGEIKLHLLVADSSQQRVLSNKKLKLRDFRNSTPLFRIAVSHVGRLAIRNPYTLAAGAILIAWGKVDPQYEKTLTTIAKLSGLDIDQFAEIPEAQLVEDPDAISGCSFEVIWLNGLGVTEVKQVDGPVKVELEELRRWAEAVDPLMDFYVMDSLDRNIGDSWDVKGKDAVSVLSSHGAKESDGSLRLKYLRDGVYQKVPVRQLAIQSGRLDMLLDRNNRETDLRAAGIQGRILYDKNDYMIMQAYGKLDAKVDITKKHLLFGARWSRDVDLDFRYEAKLFDDGK